jgi:hydroxyacylglutathione hydrolase
MGEKLAEGLRIIYGEALSSNVYLLEDKKRGILAIDAGAYRVLDEKPAMLMLTHAHFDHTGGVDESWKNVYLHKDDFRKAPYFQIPPLAKPIDFESMDWGQFKLEVIHTPGHTLGSVCLFERKKGILFSGDTLFADGIGRTDLGGDEKLMEKSLALIRKLPYKLLCPGHGELAEKG